MESKEIDILLSKYVLGLVDYKELPDIGVKFLLNDFDSILLRKLAGLTVLEDIEYEANSLFVKFLKESNIKLPEKKTASLLISLELAKKIISSEIYPYDGADQIYKISRRSGESIDELDPFIYLADQWEDYRFYRKYYERLIIEYAVKFIKQFEENITS